MRSTVPLLIAVCLLACDDDEGEVAVDAAVDVAIEADAAVEVDAAVEPDAASMPDAAPDAAVEPDVGPECAEGETRACPGCDAGEQGCADGAWGECAAPEETCGNATDDDCDLVVDEGCCEREGDCPNEARCVDGQCVAPCGDDAFESNDSPAAATPLEPGDFDDLSVCGDEDWYVFELCPLGELTVDVAFTHDLGDIDIELRDVDGGLLVEGDSGNDDERASYITGREGARVFLRVAGFRDARNTYTLAARVTGCAIPCEDDAECAEGDRCEDGFCQTPPPCLDDRFEDNDLVEAAAPLRSGPTPRLEVCEADVDWFALDVCADGRLVVEATFSHAEGDLDLALFDPEGEPAGEAASRDDDERLEVERAAEGAWRLRVSGVDGARARYALSYTVDRCACAETPECGVEETCVEGRCAPSEACQDDAAEPNQSSDEATPLVPGALVDQRLCEDEDWYAVELCAGGALEAALRFRQHEGDLDVDLLDADGAVLASAASVTDDEQLAFLSEVAGTFYLRVAGFRPTRVRYDLELAVEGCVP